MQTTPKLRLLGLVSVFAIWTLTTIARLKFNGAFAELDYGLYQPDGALYTVKTLQLLNHSLHDSIVQVNSWYANHSPHISEEVARNLSPDSHLWDVVSTRMLYPILSAPFVQIFGIGGMLAIPGISTLLFFLVILRISLRERLLFVGIALICLLSASPTFTRWMYVNYTDPLLLALFMLVAYVIYDSERSDSFARGFYFLIALVFLTSLTRFCLPIWIGISLALWPVFSLKKNLILLAFSLTCSLPSIITTTTDAVLPNLKEENLLFRLIRIPISTLETTFVELMQLLILDRVLSLIIFLAFALICLNKRDLISQSFIFVTAGVVFLSGINGVFGVNFRYHLPMLAFGVLILLDKAKLEGLISKFRNFV
jgi:hypothetical protein